MNDIGKFTDIAIINFLNLLNNVLDIVQGNLQCRKRLFGYH